MTSLVNYFRFIFSGYLRKKKVLNGVKVHFKYRHDSEIFDPITMLLDQFFKINMVKEEFRVKVNHNDYDLSMILDQLEGSKPKLGCVAKLPMGLLKVERFVVKDEFRTTSFYLIQLDDELLAFLHKKYDYGRERLSIIKDDIFGENQIDESIFRNEEEPILFDYNNGQLLYLEKFVHSHIFYVNQSDSFYKVCQYFEKISSAG
ncbi:MAG: hypothetical protein EA341_00275 [Mongoliibacter sp.]|uniref:hypothetical protein n=1 Tax=Mongoliibacter sp. TaxID=2022438 RepID=UPI0012EFCB20|nr:hypothetical protein [Mongoliibacter sp.]TVP54335.1 MAG: hypothetical protein EA341_00275 [Mongoliibacter sp.]